MTIYKKFLDSISTMLLILPVQTNAQDMSGVIDKLQEILNKLADIKNTRYRLIETVRLINGKKMVSKKD